MIQMIMIFIVCLIFYYMYLFSNIIETYKFLKKSEFWISLIPIFGYLIVSLIRKYKEL